MADNQVTPIRPGRGAVSFPETVEELRAMRLRPRQPTLNQEVERVFNILWEGTEFRSLIKATDNEGSVEGSTTCDDHVAALMIRSYARDNGIVAVDRPISVVTRSMRIVMQRYGLDRRKRADSFGEDDDLVPSNPSNPTQGSGGENAAVEAA